MNKRDFTEKTLTETAIAALNLARALNKHTINTYTDKHHKKYSTEIAALNAAQNAAGKLIVAEAVFSKTKIKALPAP